MPTFTRAPVALPLPGSGASPVFPHLRARCQLSGAATAPHFPQQRPRDRLPFPSYQVAQLFKAFPRTRPAQLLYHLINGPVTYFPPSLCFLLLAHLR